MPTGRMAWFDPNTGEGCVRQGSREYVVRTEDVDPSARVAGVRVVFDRVRSAGSEKATNVRLRGGKRSSKHHRRVGDLVGAHHPDEAGHRGLRRGLRPAPARLLEERPAEVAAQWAQALTAGESAVAERLYTSDAVLHDGDRTTQGAGAVHLFVESSPLARRAVEHITQDPPLFTVHVTDGARVDLRITHGRIVEQWVR